MNKIIDLKSPLCFFKQPEFYELLIVWGDITFSIRVTAWAAHQRVFSEARGVPGEMRADYIG